MKQDDKSGKEQRNLKVHELIACEWCN